MAKKCLIETNTLAYNGFVPLDPSRQIHSSWTTHIKARCNIFCRCHFISQSSKLACLSLPTSLTITFMVLLYILHYFSITSNNPRKSFIVSGSVHFITIVEFIRATVLLVWRLLVERHLVETHLADKDLSRSFGLMSVGRQFSFHTV